MMAMHPGYPKAWRVAFRLCPWHASTARPRRTRCIALPRTYATVDSCSPSARICLFAKRVRRMSAWLLGAAARLCLRCADRPRSGRIPEGDVCRRNQTWWRRAGLRSGTSKCIGLGRPYRKPTPHDLIKLQPATKKPVPCSAHRGSFSQIGASRRAGAVHPTAHRSNTIAVCGTRLLNWG